MYENTNNSIFVKITFLLFMVMINLFMQLKVYAEDKIIYVKESSGSANGSCGSSEDNPCPTFNAAIDEVNKAESSNNIKIYLLSNLKVNSYVQGIKNKNIIVSSKSDSEDVYKITIEGDNYYLFSLDNTSLALSNVILDGGSKERKGNFIYALNNSNITIEDGAILQNNYNANAGGTIYMETGSFTMNGGEIRNNKGNFGGAIDGSDVDIVLSGKAKISNNTSNIFGGALHVDGTSSKITISDDVEISFNKANSSGGAIYFKDGNFTMNGGTIYNNNSDEDGGGLALGDSNVTLSGNAIISNNKSGKSGGGILTVNSNVTIGDGVKIISNFATDTGGGIYVLNDSLTLNNCLFSNNIANSGGGVAIFNAKLEVNGSGTTIEKNEATYAGGGIQAFEGKATINDGKISNNTASIGGGYSLI